MGNAQNWPQSARNLGLSTGYSARANSAGVINGGLYGHVVWVESNPDADGYIIISQYNAYDQGGPGWGHYSKKRVKASTYSEFIYF